MSNNSKEFFWVLEEKLRKMELGERRELQPQVKHIVDDAIIEILEGKRKPMESLRILRRKLSEVL